MAKRERGGEVTFELAEHIGVIAELNTGWKKELNLVAWNEGPVKFDIRDWDENHEKMGRGITLNKDEVKALRDLLLNVDFER